MRGRIRSEKCNLNIHDIWDYDFTSSAPRSPSKVRACVVAGGGALVVAAWRCRGIMRTRTHNPRAATAALVTSSSYYRTDRLLVQACSAVAPGASPSIRRHISRIQQVGERASHHT